VKFTLRTCLLATVLLGSFLLTGCGGLSASPSVSPAMFLIPGMGRVAPPVNVHPPAAAPVPAAILARAD